MELETSNLADRLIVASAGRTSPKWRILCRVGCKTLSQSISLFWGACV